MCKALVQEFPDISISKIRYLEDQKLLSPRRTQGGYRLYTQSDIQRLRTILRLQRDEFLPLRVIRQELAGGRTEREVAPPAGDGRGAAPRRSSPSAIPGALYSLEDVVEETGADPTLVRELVDFGVIKGDCAAARATSTRPSARSSARSPSWPATASAGATCACSAARPTARRSCCRASSPRRCARAIPSGARRRSRRWRTWRRSHAPQAPAADPRPAQDRHLSRRRPGHGERSICAASSATSRTSRGRGSCSRTSRRCCSTPAALDARRRRLAELGAPPTVDLVVAAEARGFILGGGARAPARRRVRARRASPASCRTRRSAPSTRSSTGSTRSRSTPTRSPAAPACSSTTTCWPPAGPPGALCDLVAGLGGEIVGCAFLVELSFLGGRERLAPHHGPRADRATTTDGCRSTVAHAAARSPRLPAAHLGGARGPPPHAALVARGDARGGRRGRPLDPGVHDQAGAAGAGRLPACSRPSRRGDAPGSRRWRGRRSSACSTSR